MAERWRTVPKHPAYEVSDRGRVRRALPGPGATAGRILKTPLNGDGYPVVNIHGTPRFVHRLVAAAFLGPIPRRAQVRHRDEDKSNPRLSNLFVARNQLVHSELHRRVELDRRREGEPNPWIACACGCSRKLRKYDLRGRPRAYVQRHHLLAAAA